MDSKLPKPEIWAVASSRHICESLNADGDECKLEALFALVHYKHDRWGWNGMKRYSKYACANHLPELRENYHALT